MALTNRQKEKLKKQLEKQKRRTKAPQGVEAPVVLEAAYFKDMVKVVERTNKAIESRIIPLLDEALARGVTDAKEVKPSTKKLLKELESKIAGIQPSASSLDSYAKQIAAKHAGAQTKFHRGAFVADINRAVGVNVSTLLKEDEIRKPLRVHIGDNVDLIKSLPKQQLGTVKELLTDGLEGRRTVYNVRQEILKLSDVTVNRARVIARDQTSKWIGNLNEIRQDQIGVTHYIWRTSGDSRVRQSHKDNDGKRFAWAKPPKTGHPGHDVLCRCRPEPDLSHVLALKKAA